MDRKHLGRMEMTLKDGDKIKSFCLHLIFILLFFVIFFKFLNRKTSSKKLGNTRNIQHFNIYCQICCNLSRLERN